MPGATRSWEGREGASPRSLTGSEGPADTMILQFCPLELRQCKCYFKPCSLWNLLWLPWETNAVIYSQARVRSRRRIKAAATITRSPGGQGCGAPGLAAFTFTAVGAHPSSFTAAASCQDKTKEAR